jgi:hypothetical protein
LFNTVSFFIFVKKITMNWEQIESDFKKTFEPEHHDLIMFNWLKERIKNPPSVVYKREIPKYQENKLVAMTISTTHINFQG